MTDSAHPSDQESLAARFSAAPLELRMYVVFSTIVAVLGCGVMFFGPKSLIEDIVPFTGLGAGTNYAFTLFFAFALIFTKRIPRRTAMVWLFAIVVILVIGMYGGYQNMKKSGGNDFGNPYLKVNPLQPVWTMIIPVIWILVLLSPRVKKFLASRDPGATG